MQLTIQSGPEAGKTVQVEGNEFTIGREAGADLVLADGKASRRHAALRVLPDGRATLYDLGSSNGTFVNGQRVQSVLLNGGEQIQIGDTVLVPGGQEVGGTHGATTPGQAVPAGVAAVAAPPPQTPAPPQAPPTQQFPPAGVPPQAGQPFGGLQPPTPAPVQRPSRTQSAIQRVMLQRAVNRATIVGVVAIVLVIVVGALAAFGVFSGGNGTVGDAAIVTKVKPATYMVVTNKGTSAGRGTGWVWDASKGIIVTNAHVVAGGTQWNVARGDHLKIDVQSGKLALTPGGQDAKLLGEADCEDIGVLQVSNPAGLTTLPRSSQKNLQIGDHVVAVGYPATLNTTTSQNFQTPGFTSGDITAASGDVSQVQTTFGAIPGEGPGDPQVGPYQNVILTTTAINKGNSGGPLVDQKGRLVGMNSAGRTDVVGQNYAVGVDRISEMVPKIIAGQKVCG
jgi:putative serine protease PepD